MTPADMQRIRDLGPEKCPPEVQEDYRLAVLAQIADARAQIATVTTDTVTAQGTLPDQPRNPRTNQETTR